VLVERRETGLHQKTIDSIINQHTPEERASGASTEQWRASAASTVADSIQSCATLIMTSRISLACETAARPRPKCFRVNLAGETLYFALIARSLSPNGPDFAASHFEIDSVKRARRRPLQYVTGPYVECAFVAGAFQTLVIPIKVDRT
jgi:hypothetical protein